MILSELEAQERLESPSNLLNRLKSITKETQIVSMPPKISDIVGDIDTKISIGSAKNKALAIMATAMDELSRRVIEVDKPRELANIISEMNKVVSSQEKQDNTNNIGQIVIYAPRVVNEDVFELAKAVNE